MANYDFNVETPENYETKTICCFVLDVSLSMQGRPIDELNKGLKEFHDEISQNIQTKNRLEVGIIEFCNDVNILQTPALVDNFSPPMLVARGSTAMVDGVRIAIQMVEDRKSFYKNTNQKYKRPWIILITDGEPDPNQDINGLASETEKYTKDKKFVFLPIGVEGADMSILDKISGYGMFEGSWVKMPPKKLNGLKFMEFFAWLSESMGNVSGDDTEKAKLAKPKSPDMFDMTFEI